jgi:hypothetical protein
MFIVIFVSMTSKKKFNLPLSMCKNLLQPSWLVGTQDLKMPLGSL